MPRFGFNVAADLYKNAVHPRIHFGPDDLPKLRKQTRSGNGKKVLDHLRPAAVAAAEAMLAADDAVQLERSKDKRKTAVRGNAHRMAFIGLLDKNDRMLEAAKKALLASADDNRIDPQGYDLVAPMLTTAERRKVLRVMVDAVRERAFSRIESYYANAAHNLTFGYSLGGLWALLAIMNDPGVPKLEKETAELIRRYEATINTIIHPDGYPEEDIGYGTGVVGAQLLLGEALRRAGLIDPYKAQPGFLEFGKSMLHFVQPWGEAVSNTGDHGSTWANREFSLPRVASESKDPTVLWLASVLEDAYRTFRPEDDSEDDNAPNTVQGKGGFRIEASLNALLTLDDITKKKQHPKAANVPTQYVDRTRGIVTFRSGWDKDATFVVFDGAHRSPACPGHWHDSAGHFSISAMGEMLSIDTGRYNNEQSQHSVVMIDGKSGRSTNGEWVGSRYHGNLIDYVADDVCDVACADTSHQSNCCWARRWLGLVKGGGHNYVWTVEDINKADDWASFWYQVQTSPGNTIATRKDGATITGWKHGNCLDVSMVLPPKTEFPKQHRVKFTQDVNSTSSYKYVANPKQRAKAYVRPERMAHGPCFVRPRLIAKIEGWNGRFMSLLLPRAKGDKRAKIKQLTCVPASFAVKIEIGPYVDHLLFAYEHQLLEADDIKARGKWVVVRRKADTGRLVSWSLGHGRSLSVGGRTVV